MSHYQLFIKDSILLTVHTVMTMTIEQFIRGENVRMSIFRNQKKWTQ